jgi:hypothetical protein
MLFLSSRRNAFLYFPPATAISARSGFMMKQSDRTEKKMPSEKKIFSL